MALEYLQYTPQLIKPPLIEYFLLSNHLQLRAGAAKLLNVSHGKELLITFFQSLSITDFSQNMIHLKGNFNAKVLEEKLFPMMESPLELSTEKVKLIYKCSGMIGSEKSFKLLISKLTTESENSHYDTILKAALSIMERHQFKGINKQILLQLLSERIHSAYKFLGQLQTLNQNSHDVLCIDYFNYSCQLEMQRIINILKLIQFDSNLIGLEKKLKLGENSVNASVYEIIEDCIPHTLKNSISHIFNGQPQEKHYEKQWAINEIIIQLLNGDTIWKNVLGISLAAEQNLLNSLSESLSKSAQSHPLIKNEILAVKTQKSKESKSMYSHLDKTLFLKGTELFSKLSGEELFQISQIADEEEFLKDEIIFHEGEQGDSMYIILQGRLSIFIGNEEIAQLQKGECFGEMALLDGEPRSTSIRALEESKLLTIREENFYSLAEGNINLIQGIVRILSARLRQANAA